MKKVAKENDCDNFDPNNADVCINCFVDSKLFWTASYRPKSQYTKEEKSWKYLKWSIFMIMTLTLNLFDMVYLSGNVNQWANQWWSLFWSPFVIFNSNRLTMLNVPGNHEKSISAENGRTPFIENRFLTWFLWLSEISQSPLATLGNSILSKILSFKYFLTIFFFPAKAEMLYFSKRKKGDQKGDHAKLYFSLKFQDFLKFFEKSWNFKLK